MIDKDRVHQIDSTITGHAMFLLKPNLYLMRMTTTSNKMIDHSI